MSTFDEPRNRPEREPLWTLLGVAILLIVFACAAGLIVGIPFYQQYPAKITKPDRLYDLDLLPGSADLGVTYDALGQPAREYLRSFPSIGIYSNEVRTQEILVWAMPRLVLFPVSEVDQALAAFAQVTDEVGEIVEVPTGELGGSTKCTYFRFKDYGSERGVLCGWADHGSIGIVALAPELDREVAARKFLDIRSAVESH